MHESAAAYARTAKTTLSGRDLALISQIMTIVGGLTRPAKSIFRVEACARGGG
jgi:hypothetical protein